MTDANDWYDTHRDRMKFTCWAEAALVLGRCSMEDKLPVTSFSMMSFAIWNDSATVSVTASAYDTFTELTYLRYKQKQVRSKHPTVIDTRHTQREKLTCWTEPACIICQQIQQIMYASATVKYKILKKRLFIELQDSSKSLHYYDTSSLHSKFVMETVTIIFSTV